MVVIRLFRCRWMEASWSSADILQDTLVTLIIALFHHLNLTMFWFCFQWLNDYFTDYITASPNRACNYMDKARFTQVLTVSLSYICPSPQKFPWMSLPRTLRGAASTSISGRDKRRRSQLLTLTPAVGESTSPCWRAVVCPSDCQVQNTRWVPG